MIHPGTVLKIARLEQRAIKSEWQPVSSDGDAFVFREFVLKVQLAAEEFPNTADSRVIAEKGWSL